MEEFFQLRMHWIEQGHESFSRLIVVYFSLIKRMVRSNQCSFPHGGHQRGSHPLWNVQPWLTVLIIVITTGRSCQFFFEQLIYIFELPCQLTLVRRRTTCYHSHQGAIRTKDRPHSIWFTQEPYYPQVAFEPKIVSEGGNFTPSPWPSRLPSWWCLIVVIIGSNCCLFLDSKVACQTLRLNVGWRHKREEIRDLEYQYRGCDQA